MLLYEDGIGLIVSLIYYPFGDMVHCQRATIKIIG